MQDMMVLLAHGSRDESWAQTFRTMTQTLCQDKQNIRLAFMELNSPSLEDIAKEAVKLGCQSLTVLPLFLAKGKHLKKDIPQQLSALEGSLGISTNLLPPIGEQPELAFAIHQIVKRYHAE